MDKIYLNNDDVVSMDEDANFTGFSTAKSKEMLVALGNLVSENTSLNTTAVSNWVEDGVDCQVLQAEEGGGWQIGKVRLCIEFIPNEP